MNQTIPTGNPAVGVIIVGVLTVLVATTGYKYIHMLGRISTIVGILGFTYLGIQLFLKHDVGAVLGAGGFAFPTFLLAMPKGHEFLAGGGAVAVLVYIVIVVGKLTVNTLNAYGGYMTILTSVSAFTRQLRFAPWVRFAYVIGFIAVSVLIEGKVDVPALYDPKGRYGA